MPTARGSGTQQLAEKCVFETSPSRRRATGSTHAEDLPVVVRPLTCNWELSHIRGSGGVHKGEAIRLQVVELPIPLPLCEINQIEKAVLSILVVNWQHCTSPTM